MDKKQTGSFYTPESLICYMVEYVHSRIVPHSILEPSAGDGCFTKALHSFGCPVTLVEIESRKISELKNTYSNFCKIINTDYLDFSLHQEKTYDLIIGNPPYIRKNAFA